MPAGCLKIVFFAIAHRKLYAYHVGVFPVPFRIENAGGKGVVRALCYCIQAFFGFSMCQSAEIFWLIWALLEHENQRTEELQPDDIPGTWNVGQRNETDATAIQRSSPARAVQAQASR